MRRNFLFWWLVVVCVSVALVLLYRAGTLAYLFESDRSYCVIAVFVVFAIATILQGFALWGNENSNFTKRAIEFCEMLGFLGTVTGFILVFQEAGDSSKEVVQAIKSNLNTAFLTTYTGIVASILLRLQVRFKGDC